MTSRQPRVFHALFPRPRPGESHVVFGLYGGLSPAQTFTLQRGPLSIPALPSPAIDWIALSATVGMQLFVVNVVLGIVGGLSVMLWLSGRSKRELRANIAALEEALAAVQEHAPAEARAVVAVGEDEPEAVLTQERPDELFAVGDAETQLSLGTFRTESAAMTQKSEALHQRNRQLRQAVGAIRDNRALPEDEQQKIVVPEKLLLEIETDLSSLQQTCQSLQGSLQEHCALLEGKLGERETQDGEGSTAGVNVQHVKAELEQRAADFQRIQEEYDALLSEYQCIYET